jgi:hypothetical protein
MTDKRMTREQAQHYHPSNYFNRQLEAIWTVDDFNQTVLDAQAVVEAGKLRDSERLSPAVMFSASRARRAKRMDALAVALLMLLMAALGCIALLWMAPQASAAPDGLDVSDEVLDYASDRGQIVCRVLDEYPSVSGLIGVMQGISEDGFSYFEAGQVTALSVYSFCPRHSDLLEQFVAIYGEEAQAVA